MSNQPISFPRLSEASDRDLTVESTLKALPLYSFEVETTCLGIQVARIFEKYSTLPGAILVEQGKFVGMISRLRLLESLLRPHRLELFLHKPLHVLFGYARTDVLILPDTTPILAAAQMALRRSPELLGEPIVVLSEPNTYQLLDIHELNIAHWQIRGIETQVRYERSQVQMIQTEKMANLGRLVDGVAHEILDPVSFIWGNLTHLSTYSESLMQLVAAYEQHLPEISEIEELKEEIEFDFLLQDLPRAIKSIRSGAERLKKLVVSLQNFCHIDQVYPKPADIHALLDSIILLIESRLRSDIEIVKNYGELPPVTCFAGQLNQVFMNILVNAVDALLNHAVRRKFSQEFLDKTPDIVEAKPRIEITTKVCSLEKSSNTPDMKPRWVSITIGDNGPGLSPNLKKRILESFSVERRAEKETSLALSYWIVTAKHGGRLLIRSVRDENDLNSGLPPGVGTEFEILLPLV